MKINRSAMRSGFALPTVLIASIVMIIVLMTGLATASSTSAQLDQQYYTQLAREAAESGVTFANRCLQENEFNVPWSGGVLRTGQTCTRTNASAPNYIVQTAGYRTRYEVASVPNQPGQNTLTVRGIAEVLRQGSGAVWRTFSYDLRAQVSSELSAQNITFGYRWSGGSSPDTGAFFGVLTQKGDVFTTGLNSSGQLGHGNATNSTTPKRYQLPASVSAAEIHTNFLSIGQALYVITTDGRLFAAGNNDVGQLTGTIHPVTTPREITFPGVTSPRVVGVEQLGGATFATLSNGQIYAAGSCVNGQLGTGSTCTNTSTMRRVALPTTLPAPIAVGKVVGDADTAYTMTSDGRVYGWGWNSYGQLGSSHPVGAAVSTPVRIGSFGSSYSNAATQLSFDGRTIYVVTEDGNLYAMGDNSDFQINGTSTQIYTTPQLVNVNGAGCSGVVIDAKTDRSHVAVLTSGGHVCTMGYNANGELGRGSTAARLPLGQVTLPTGVRAVSIWVNSIYGQNSGWSNNTFIVGDNGGVYGTGSNVYGQLGTGNYTGTNSFVRMQLFGSGANQIRASRVQSGLGTTIIYTEIGRIYAVGNNQTGQLGDGTTTNNPNPRATRFINVVSPTLF